MKAGDIIQNHQGRFAKIVSIKDSRFGITGWMLRKEDAKKDTRVMVFLNKYGLAAVQPAKAPKEAKPKGPKAPKAK
jgi:hypothetical protein